MGAPTSYSGFFDDRTATRTRLAFTSEDPRKANVTTLLALSIYIVLVG